MGELFRPNTHAGSSDSAGKDERTRIWRVSVPPSGNWLGVDPTLPAVGSVYPYGNPNPAFPLRLDRFDIAPTEDGNGTYITLVYTNDRSGRIRPVVDTTRPGVHLPGVSIQKTTQDVQTVIVFPQPVPGANVVEAETPDAETRIYKAAHTFTVYEITVTLSSMGKDVSEAIRKQTDHIHYINNAYYRFEPGETIAVEPNVWNATYRWISDEGLLNISGLPLVQTGPGEPPFVQIGPASDNRRWYFPPITPNRLPNPVGGHEQPEMMRSPFHVLSFALTKAMVPQYEQMCTFVIDPNGWRSLPGDLNL